MRQLLLSLLLSTLIFTSQAAQAENAEMAVAAVVNDDVITSHDVMQRLKLILALNSLQDTPQTRQRLLPQVTRSLVDETLKLQAARRTSVNVRPEDFNAAIAKIERTNPNLGGDVETFLSSHHLPERSFRQQLQANIAWSKLVMTRLRNRVTVSREEIADTLKQISGQESLREYQIESISLPVENPDEDESVRKVIEQLAGEIKGGANFALLKQQFAPDTVNAGGDTVPQWLTEDRIDEALRPILLEMQPNTVSPPVRTAGGYQIVHLIDKRNTTLSNPDDTEVSLHQLTVPVKQENENEMNKAFEQITALKASLKECPQIASLQTLSPGASHADLGRVQIKSLHAKIRDMVRGLPVNGVTAPFRTPSGFQVLMVCEKISATASLLPDDEQIKDMLMQQKLELQATQYMRNLRREAFVEVRL